MDVGATPSPSTETRFVNVRDLNDFDVARTHFRDDGGQIEDCVLRYGVGGRPSLYGTNNMLDVFSRRIKFIITRKSFLTKYRLTRELRIGDDSLRSSLDEVARNIIEAWDRFFKTRRTSINWRKFCSNDIVELNMNARARTLTTIASSSAVDHARTDQQHRSSPLSLPAHESGAEEEESEMVRRSFDLFYDSVQMVLRRADLSSLFGRTRVIRRQITRNDARLMCLILRERADFLASVNLLLTMERDPVFMIEHRLACEKLVHSYYLSRLKLYTLNREKYSCDLSSRDWSFIEDVMSSRQDSIQIYRNVALASERLRSNQRLNVDLSFSLIHSHVRVIVLHDLVTRYLIRRYFCHRGPKLRVFPFEAIRSIDVDRVNFFVFIVNAFVKPERKFEACDLASSQDFWFSVLSHCASISPSTFVAQIFTYIVPLETRVTLTVHDVLDYVSWLCREDPWYLHYSSGIIERYRLFNENTLKRQFAALYDTDNFLYFVLVAKNIACPLERAKYIVENSRAYTADLTRARQFSVISDFFDYTNRDCAVSDPTSENWFELSSKVFSYDCYYNTFDFSLRLVETYVLYFLERNAASTPSSRKSSVGSSSCQDAIAPHSPASTSPVPPPFAQPTDPHEKDNLAFLMSKAKPKKRSARSDRETQDAPIVADNEDASSIESHQGNSRASKGKTKVSPVIVAMRKRHKLILQNALNFLNDICLLYNGTFMNQGRADYLQKFDKRLIKNLDTNFSTRWKEDSELSKFLATPSDVDWSALEENCFRDKTTESPSISMGNFLAQHKTAEINMYFLRVLDGSHSFSMYNILTRRYEVCAPSLMFLLRLDYKNWFLTSRESYPSNVDRNIAEYATLCLESVDTFVKKVNAIDSMSMILHSKLIREKKIGLERFDAASTHSAAPQPNVTVLTPSSQSTATASTSSAPPIPRSKRTLTRPTDSLVPAPDTSGDDLSQASLESEFDQERSNADKTSSYVDFVIDQTEFLGLSASISVNWIQEYFVRSVEQRRYDLAYFFVFLLQIVARFGTAFLERDSFQRVVLNEFLDSYVKRCALQYFDSQRSKYARFCKKLQAHSVALDVSSPSDRVEASSSSAKTTIPSRNLLPSSADAASSLLDDFNDILSTPFYEDDARKLNIAESSSPSLNLADSAANIELVESISKNSNDFSHVLRQQLRLCLANGSVDRARDSDFERDTAAAFLLADRGSAEKTASKGSAVDPSVLASASPGTADDGVGASDVNARWSRSYEESLASFSATRNFNRNARDSNSRRTARPGGNGNSRLVDEIVTDQNLRQVFSKLVHSREFFSWLRDDAPNDRVFRLSNLLNMNDRTFVRVFALYLNLLRAMENFRLGAKDADLATPANEVKVVSWVVRKTRVRRDVESTLAGVDAPTEEYYEEFDFDAALERPVEELAKIRLYKITRNFDADFLLRQVLSPATTLCDHIWLSVAHSLKDLRAFFPSCFVVSRGTINLAESFVDFLDSRSEDLDKRISNVRVTRSRFGGGSGLRDKGGELDEGEVDENDGESVFASRHMDLDLARDRLREARSTSLAFAANDDNYNDLFVLFSQKVETLTEETKREVSRRRKRHRSPSPPVNPSSHHPSSNPPPFSLSQSASQGEGRPLFESLFPDSFPHSTISREIRLSIAYAVFVVYIFCGRDIAVTLYMLKFLVSPLFPGPWSKESTASVFVGTSNSGKSRLVNLIRRFYNSEHGNLNTSILDTSKDNISTAFIPIASNLVCQIDEPRECDAETFKNLISDTPKQARAFHSQQQQALSNIAKIFITVNQMFQVLSDDGVLTRLQSFFRVTHRHLDLVKAQSDVTKINGEASMNVAHQFVSQNYPKGLHEQTFLRGLFFLVFHWCPSLVTFREEKFTFADIVCSHNRECLRFLVSRGSADRGTELESYSTVPTSAFDRKLDSYFNVRASRDNEDVNFRMGDEQTGNYLTECLFRRLSFVRDLPSFLGINRNLIHLRKLYLLAYTKVNEVDVMNFFLIYPRKHRLLVYISDVLFGNSSSFTFSSSSSSSTSFSSVSPSSIASASTAPVSTADSSSSSSRLYASSRFYKLIDDDYDDNHVNLAVKPYKLELLTSEMHNNFDAFVRFQNTHRVVSAETPISREKLEYYLASFLERFNSTIADAKYRVKFSEFYERFVNEYSRFQYVDPKTNRVIPNKWSLRVKSVVCT